jgi:hypothetical protein
VNQVARVGYPVARVLIAVDMAAVGCSSGGSDEFDGFPVWDLDDQLAILP